MPTTNTQIPQVPAPTERLSLSTSSARSACDPSGAANWPATYNCFEA